MNVLITGGRNFAWRNRLFGTLDSIHEEYTISVLVHGGARGADALGGEWARLSNVDVMEVRPDWRRYHRGAGVIRNREMLELAEPDMVVAFPGGSGTEDMIALAEHHRIRVVRPIELRKGVQIGFSGTKRGMTQEQSTCVRDALLSFGDIAAVHHGDCVGADAEFHNVSRSLDLYVHIHPPRDGRRRAYCDEALRSMPPKPYLQRNHAIVDAVAVLIAAPSNEHEKVRSGTWATIRYARKTERKIFLMLPNGEMVFE